MAMGMRVWDAGSNLILDSDTRAGRFIATAYLNTDILYLYSDSFIGAQHFVIFLPDVPNYYGPPSTSLSGGTLTVYPVSLTYDGQQRYSKGYVMCGVY